MYIKLDENSYSLIPLFGYFTPMMGSIKINHVVVVCVCVCVYPHYWSNLGHMVNGSREHSTKTGLSRIWIHSLQICNAIYASAVDRHLNHKQKNYFQMAKEKMDTSPNWWNPKQLSVMHFHSNKIHKYKDYQYQI